MWVGHCDDVSAPKGRTNTAQANGLGEESMPRNWPALKGRDEPLDTSEATVRGGQRLVISPLQGLLPERMGSRSSPRPLAHRR